MNFRENIFIFFNINIIQYSLIKINYYVTKRLHAEERIQYDLK